jgi:type IV secretion system protein VirB6
MGGSCNFAEGMGVVRDMLAAVDCNTRDFAMLGYQSLTTNVAFQTALTICLTIYVALIGYRLLYASEGVRLSDGPGMALRIGATLALVTSWGLFQTLVFDMAARAPLEIAGLISAPIQDNSALTSDPVGGLQAAYDQMSGAAGSLGKTAGAAAQTQENQESEAAGLPAIAADVIFLGSAGLVAVVMIATGVLTAIGPVFVILFLFLETRGLFVGWVRALCAAALALLSSWTLIVLMLHVLEPWLLELGQQGEAGPANEQVATTAAAIVFIFAACQIGMIVAGFVIASGFSLRNRRRTQPASQRMVAETRQTLAVPAISRPARLAEQLQRADARFATVHATAPEPYRTAAATSAAGFEAPRGQFYRRPFLAHADRPRPAESA